MSSSKKYLCGIDLGGTKIEGVILENSERGYVPLFRHRIATEAHLGYAHILNRIHSLVGALSDKTSVKIEELGIGTPGRMDSKTGTLKNSNTTCINGQAFLSDLETILQMPVSIENDANCFALSEAKEFEKSYGPAELVFGVIMGSGVGGGIVAHGKIISGTHGIGGEWGHNFLDSSGGNCYCGRVGCTETIISGPALERFYLQNSGKSKKLREIVDLARQNEDSIAKLTLERLITNFGKGVAQIINVLDPTAIILGGGVGNIDELYTQGVQEIEKYLFNDYLDTKIVKPVLGDSSGVFGAAYLNL